MLRYKLFYADMDIDDEDIFHSQPSYERDELGRYLASKPPVMLDRYVVYESDRMWSTVDMDAECYTAKGWLAEWKQLYDPTRPLNVRKT